MQSEMDDQDVKVHPGGLDPPLWTAATAGAIEHLKATLFLLVLETAKECMCPQFMPLVRRSQAGARLEQPVSFRVVPLP